MNENQRDVHHPNGFVVAEPATRTNGRWKNNSRDAENRRDAEEVEQFGLVSGVSIRKRGNETSLLISRVGWFGGLEINGRDGIGHDLFHSR